MNLFKLAGILYLLVIGHITPAHTENAEDIYFRACIICHGDDGSGNMPGVPDLAENDALIGNNDTAIIKRMKTGINNPGKLSMPPKGGDPELTDKQLSEVLQYIKKLIKP